MLCGRFGVTARSLLLRFSRSLSGWFEQRRIQCGSGCAAAAAADGVTEAANARDEEFGEDRLIQVASALRDRDAQELKNRILQAVATFTGGRAQDDATLLVISIA